MDTHQDDIDTVLYFLMEEMGVDVILDHSEPNAYWQNGRGAISISTKQNKRLNFIVFFTKLVTR